jgi:hypothetical protein
MEKQHPSPAMGLPISMEIYQQLVTASVSSGFEKETWEIGAAAIREWMVRNNPDSFAMPATAGYQWKSLFLPNGTLLRTIFNGKNFHCVVEGDHILYNEQSVSPSGFANAVGGVRRNAWKVIWILFPNSSVWKLAGTLRVKKNAQRLRPSKGQHTANARTEPHRSAQPADEQHSRDDRRRRDRREQRAGQDRRHIQQTVHQHHAPEPGRAQQAPDACHKHDGADLEERLPAHGTGVPTCQQSGSPRQALERAANQQEARRVERARPWHRRGRHDAPCHHDDQQSRRQLQEEEPPP